MKFKVWLDSGANHDSCHNQIIDLLDLGITDEEWAAMSEESREEVMRDVAWDRMDWGWHEIEGQGDE